MAAMVCLPEGVFRHLICRWQRTSSSINTVPHTTFYTPLVCAVIGVTGLINDEAP